MVSRIAGPKERASGVSMDQTNPHEFLSSFKPSGVHPRAFGDLVDEPPVLA